ncbi:H(+)/Cl(-) exchange transporter 5-like isoform X2 [Uloborus diversus]|uniref:H(+)/Cl(-) exchange transporter 5-like isoform X2 n=1 Tax=Uloborus diversus TaxID=327109 RepID=UPI00240A3201|nr:H(+)/Cl(-) exchange transporter 5-like isoform X2 [Uloborus diversus]
MQPNDSTKSLCSRSGVSGKSNSYLTFDSETMETTAQQQRWKRRQSSESSLIHITGTGTILEETLSCGQCYKGLPLEKDCCQDYEKFHPGVGQYDDFHTIDWQRDLSRDKYRQRYISRKMEESTWNLLKGYFDKASGWICVFLVGISAGSVAGFIDVAETWMKDLKEGICLQAFWFNKEQCCWLSNTTFYEGDECNEIKTILSGFIMRGYLGKWTLLIKSVSIMLAVSAGLSLGKEGPLVHIVCCIGNIISYFFPKYGKNEAKKREILSAAAAAGVSVAFGAPIGGILFSLEEVSYYFPLKTLWRSFFCALVAVFVLRSIDPFGNDHVVKFFIKSSREWILIELIPFGVLGILGGILGAVFIRCNISWSRLRKTSRLGNFPLLEVMVITLVTAVIHFPDVLLRMNASDLIKALFSQCGLHDVSPLCDYKRNISSTDQNMKMLTEANQGTYASIYQLLLTLVCKFVITVFTFGIKVPTGLFIPSLAMGALLGRIVGIGMQEIALNYKNSWPFHTTCSFNEDCISPGLYAMIGAAACLAGVTRMTISLVVIMFELTGNVSYIVPLMATVVVSKWVGDAIDRDGIYDAHINLNQYPYMDNKTSFKFSTTAIDLSSNKKELVCLVQKGMVLEEVEIILQETKHNGFPVIASVEEPHLIGYVLRRDLCLMLDYMKDTSKKIDRNAPLIFMNSGNRNRNHFHLNLEKIVDMAPATVIEHTPLETVIEMFCKLGLRQILVTDHKGKLLDILTKKDVLDYMNKN